MKSSPILEQKLLVLSGSGVLTPRTENNPHLKVSYKGAGALISSKWNVKIYTSGSVVCTDVKVLEDIIQDKLKEPDSSKKVLQIDDAGIGFPLLGVMVGVYNGETLLTDTINVSYFQGYKFKARSYLAAYEKAGRDIIYNKFKVFPDTHRVEICSGHINSGLKDGLREDGFDVRTVEITGYLQDNLEGLFREYVKQKTGQDLAYDPKGLSNKELAKNYYKALNWGKKNARQLLKSGWESIGGK